LAFWSASCLWPPLPVSQWLHVPLPSADRLLVVGAATPSFAAWILAILSFVAAAIQVLGFIGVVKVSLITLLPLDEFVLNMLCTKGKGHIISKIRQLTLSSYAWNIRCRGSMDNPIGNSALHR
jgi:hypothetical protein